VCPGRPSGTRPPVRFQVISLPHYDFPLLTWAYRPKTGVPCSLFLPHLREQLAAPPPSHRYSVACRPHLPHIPFLPPPSSSPTAQQQSHAATPIHVQIDQYIGVLVLVAPQGASSPPTEERSPKFVCKWTHYRLRQPLASGRCCQPPSRDSYMTARRVTPPRLPRPSRGNHVQLVAKVQGWARRCSCAGGNSLCELVFFSEGEWRDMALFWSRFS
jgi:hypothetical protein